ncbi:hypothetical protein ACWFQ8_30185 [Streptomyces sp. NPDC055254]
MAELPDEGAEVDEHGRAPGVPSRTGTGSGAPPADPERVERAAGPAPAGSERTSSPEAADERPDTDRNG